MEKEEVKQIEQVEVTQDYELSTEYGFFKRVFIGILLYLLFISSKKLKFTTKKKYIKP